MVYLLTNNGHNNHYEWTEGQTKITILQTSHKTQATCNDG